MAVAREPGVERGGGLRRRASREPSATQLELGMREHAVERLLAGEAGGAEDGDRDHLRIMQKYLHLCEALSTLR